MPSSPRPNLLLILTDHWRGDCLGRLGNPAVETPHLDSLSAAGVTFTNAFSPCPSCIPARRSIMTGMTPDGHEMVGYQDHRPWNYTRPLAGELARAGYQTINVGKTHFHPKRLHLGFEELIIPVDYDEWIDRTTGVPRARMAHGVHANSWMARPNHLPEIQMEETWLTSQAIERLEKRDPTRPFFLCLSFNGPHPPWCPPQHYFDKFMRKTLPGPVAGEWAAHHANDTQYPMNINAWRGQLSDEENHVARAGFFAYLAYIDAQIGRFMEFLSRAGLLQDTYTLFTSDHGEMLGDHHLWRKTYPYDASARIPFIVNPPANHECLRNHQSNGLVGLEDIMPTLLEAAGVPIPETVNGLSLAGYLNEKPSNASRLYYHHEHSPCYDKECAYQCLVSQDWKYVWNPITGAEQLFDRTQDPYDCHDLASRDDHQDTLKTWREQMVAHLKNRPEGFSDGKTLFPQAYTAYRADAPS